MLFCKHSFTEDGTLSISATGLATGLDVESLVSQLVAAEIATPANRYDRREAKYQLEISSLGTLKGELSAFQTSLSAVSQVGTYQSKSSSSSLSSSVAISASADALVGSYAVSVTNLAVAQSFALADDAFTAVTDPVGQGTLSITDGQQTVDILIDETNDSLQGLAAAINNSGANASAAIVNDGSGYRLVLSASETGLSNTLAITASADADNNLTDASGLSRFITANLTETISAEDAALTINGLSVTSASNTVTSALDGVSLTLKSETDLGEVVNLTVSQDKAKLISAVNTFVEGYNNLIDTISALTSYDASSQLGSALTGDAGVRTIAAGIRNLLNTNVENVSGNFSNIAEIGITSSALTGKLSIDSGTLDAVVVAEPLDVANIFASLGRSSSENIGFVSATAATKVGEYAVNFTPPTAGAITSAAFNVNGNNLNFSGNNSDVQFTVTVDGVTSSTITLDADYSTGGSDAANLGLLASGLQTKINAALTDNQVTVTADTVNNKLTVQSNSTGAGSAVAFTEVVRLGSIGMDAGTSSIAGVAGAGTINGLDATYDSSANTLTGAVGSVVEGLILKLKGNASGELGQVKYSVGLASDLDELLTGYLATDGLIDARLDGLAKSVSALDDQREALEFRASALEARYRKQFNGLETLISQLNTTQSFLSSALSQFVEPLDFKK